MPPYFLHLRDGEKLIEDPDGADFPDLGAAREEARASARDLLAAMVKAGTAIGHWQIEITDEADHVVGTVALKDVLVWA